MHTPDVIRAGFELLIKLKQNPSKRYWAVDKGNTIKTFLYTPEDNNVILHICDKKEFLSASKQGLPVKWKVSYLDMDIFYSIVEESLAEGTTQCADTSQALSLEKAMDVAWMKLKALREAESV